MNYTINSKLNPADVLASVLTAGQSAGRVDASDQTEILQVSTITLPQGKILKSHKHKPVERRTVGTQEAWLVMSGQLQARVFDTDNEFVEEIILTTGQCMTLFRGGHTFTVLTDDTVIYEIKNGPYYGPEIDSEAI
jgi:cupin fold WbuC family metalloprotein